MTKFALGSDLHLEFNVKRCPWKNTDDAKILLSGKGSLNNLLFNGYVPHMKQGKNPRGKIMHEIAVDINKVLADINVMSCVKDVFRSLSKTGYLTPKTYFEQLSEVDLSTLMLMSADMDSEKTSEAALHQLTMLTIGFLVGENSPVSEGNVEESLKYVVLMITLESLARKGLIKPLRENWCLSGDPKALWAENIE